MNPLPESAPNAVSTYWRQQLSPSTARKTICVVPAPLVSETGLDEMLSPDSNGLTGNDTVTGFRKLVTTWPVLGSKASTRRVNVRPEMVASPSPEIGGFATRARRRGKLTVT